MNTEAIKELLYKMADDMLIIGHRNSEWTGLGPILEEDIAFSSMAQDKLGQAQALYDILHQLGEKDPDTVAFNRDWRQFKNSQFTELPNDDYDFSTIRHFLYDHADQIRFNILSESTFEPLARVARKIKGEIKYHVFHADTWVVKLGKAEGESHDRMQRALNVAWDYALGIFEQGPFEKELASESIFPGEAVIKAHWLSTITPILDKAGLSIPHSNKWDPKLGGRQGYHTDFLEPLVTEMGEVFRLDPNAEW